MKSEIIRRIVIIGNSGGGKTTLSRRLHRIHQLPLFHVDSIQFLPGMQIRNHHESIAVLTDIQNQENWIIEGYGPLDILEKRLALADRVVFIDFPLWKHMYWSLKRQLYYLITRSQRAELPDNCFEGTWSQTRRLFKSIRNVHYQMRPEMMRILSRENLKPKVQHINNQKQWNLLYQSGLK